MLKWQEANTVLLVQRVLMKAKLIIIVLLLVIIGQNMSGRVVSGNPPLAPPQLAEISHNWLRPFAQPVGIEIGVTVPWPAGTGEEYTVGFTFRQWQKYNYVFESDDGTVVRFRTLGPHFDPNDRLNLKDFADIVKGIE